MSAGAIAFGSLPAMIIASGLYCDGGVDDRDLRRRAGVGRARDAVRAAELLSASSTPECSNSSYGLPSCFGIETVLRPVLIWRWDRRCRSDVSTMPLADELSAASSLVSHRRRARAARPAGERGEQRTRACADVIELQDPPQGVDVERRRRASATRRARFGPSTEPTRRSPVTIWIQYDEIDSLSSSAFWMPPSSSSARMTPDDRAAAAEDRDAAEQHRGDRRSARSPGRRSRRAVELRSVMTMPASAATAPETREQDQLDPLDAQARRSTRLLVGPDRVDRAPERRRVQQHAEADGEHRRTAPSCWG